VQVLRLYYRPTPSDQLRRPLTGSAADDPRWSMVLMLPRQRFGLDALLAGLSGRELLLDWARRCESTCVKVEVHMIRCMCEKKLIKFNCN
jgi:hypothetical protein